MILTTQNGVSFYQFRNLAACSGIEHRIFTRSGGSIGLSFAIPVSVVRNVVDQLKSEGRVTRGWLGVTIQDVDKNLAESFGLDRPRGALVSQVSDGSPADESGLKAGDVIGLRADNSASLYYYGLAAVQSVDSAQVILNLLVYSNGRSPNQKLNMDTGLSF